MNPSSFHYRNSGILPDKYYNRFRCNPLYNCPRNHSYNFHHKYPCNYQNNHLDTYLYKSLYSHVHTMLYNDNLVRISDPLQTMEFQ